MGPLYFRRYVDVKTGGLITTRQPAAIKMDDVTPFFYSVIRAVAPAPIFFVKVVASNVIIIQPTKHSKPLPVNVWTAPQTAPNVLSLEFPVFVYGLDCPFELFA